jgi:hypothetical protein
MNITKFSRVKNKALSFNDVEKVLLGTLLSKENNKLSQVEDLSEVEFKVFSQWGDDGIIQYLANKINIPHKVFVEFGVEGYHESNTRFLLMKDNWEGMVIDGSAKNIKSIKSQDISWRHTLHAVNAFITTENINHIISNSGISGEIGILSVDIDGNDYWVTEAINAVNPVLLINEYNSVFGNERAITVPYDASFVRSTAHHSNLYYGASLAALHYLADKKGYSFIGCNSNGNNAYFVRNDKLNGLKVKTVKEGFVDAKFRESRNAEGELTFLSGNGRLEYIKGLPVVNVLNNQLESL